MKRDKHRFRGRGYQNQSRNGNKDMKEKEKNKEKISGQIPEDAVATDDINATSVEEELADKEVTGETAGEGDEDCVGEDVKALDENEDLSKEINDLKSQLEKEKKEYMFLMADFDNYKKNALKQRTELIKNAAEGTFKGLLPIVDDMERAIKHGESSEDAAALKEGMELIYKKLKTYMEQNGVKEMESVGEPFNSDLQEAVAMVPVTDETQKGKVLEAVEKGYTINDKVLRHAKVVVGR